MTGDSAPGADFGYDLVYIRVISDPKHRSGVRPYPGARQPAGKQMAENIDLLTISTPFAAGSFDVTVVNGTERLSRPYEYFATLSSARTSIDPNKFIDQSVTISLGDPTGKGRYISGIGHKKYRADFPDPRVQKLTELTKQLPEHPFTDFARAVEAETIQKKSNLILNIDGTIAAGLLDVLHVTQGYSFEDLAALVDDEFFNALFVLSRSVGFMAHYFDQRRIDEGLFRLSDDQVTQLKI